MQTVSFFIISVLAPVEASEGDGFSVRGLSGRMFVPRESTDLADILACGIHDVEVGLIPSLQVGKESNAFPVRRPSGVVNPTGKAGELPS